MSATLEWVLIIWVLQENILQGIILVSYLHWNNFARDDKRIVIVWDLPVSRPFVPNLPFPIQLTLRTTRNRRK